MLHKHADLSLNPQNHIKKKPGMVTGACNPSIEGWRQADLQSFQPASPKGCTSDSVRALSPGNEARIKCQLQSKAIIKHDSIYIKKCRQNKTEILAEANQVLVKLEFLI